MGHNIEFFTYKENVNKHKVQQDLDTYVSHQTWQEGGGGTSGIRWLDHVLCQNREEAEKYIESHDKGWYDCLAVRYYEPVEVQNTQKMIDLDNAYKSAAKTYHDRASVLYPSSLSSRFISCKSCESRLARDLLKSNQCPVCHADLRPEHILKSIETAKQKSNRAYVAYMEYRQKHSKKEIKWLVKIEYHT